MNGVLKLLFLLSSFGTAQASSRTQLERLLLHADSVEQFVSSAPSEMRENYTLVYESRSPFAASITPDFPRVVLFSPDAKAVLTFTGQPRGAGADIVEALYFNDETARFEPASYILPKALRDRGPQSRNEVANCVHCHGEDTRPIFDSYPLWPGFYGAVKDSFLEGLELSKFTHFQSTSAKAGVYRLLKPPGGNRTSPFLEPEKLISGAIEADPANFKYTPNTRLGMALTELNRKRIFRKLKASPDYIANEKSLLSSLLECGAEKVDDVKVSELRSRLTNENADRIERLRLDATSAVAQSPEMQELKFLPEVAQVSNLSDVLHVSMNDWSMAYAPAASGLTSYAFFDGILSGISEGRSFYIKEDFIYEMLKRLARSDSRYFKYFRVLSSFAEYDYPFGHRLDLRTARGACALLTSRK